MSTVPSNLIPTRTTQLPLYAGSNTNGTIVYVLSGVTYQAQLSTLFAAVGGGTVTSVNVSGGSTGLSFSGGPVTLNGTITAGGTLLVANGGTGAATAAGARANILPSFSGNAGKVLAVNGGETDVAYIAAATGTVTSLDASGGSTGLSFSGGPVTSSGTLTLAGTLALASGGTGAGNAAGARAAILPSYAGNGGKVLAVNAGTTDVEYITVSGSGTVTSVAVSGGTTGLSASGGPITGAGTITLGGTLGVANGGTGQTSYTNGQLLIGNTTGNTLAKATLTAGAAISITNGAGSITIATPITSTGDLIVGNGPNSGTRLAIGTSGQVLTSNGTTAAWATPAAAGAWTLLATLTSTGAGPWDFTSISSSYSDLAIEINATHAGTAGSMQLAVSPDGSTWSTVKSISESIASAPMRGNVFLPHYRGDLIQLIGAVSQDAGSSPAYLNAPGSGFQSVGSFLCTGGITGVRVQLGNGTLSATSIKLYAR